MAYRDREQQRAYQRAWLARRRAEFLAGKACVHCGSDRDLEVDHIDPAQKITHVVWSWAKERREAELAKCQVLCNPCHLVKTVTAHEVKHNNSRYTGHGCRCDACRADHARVNALYR